LPVMIGLVVLAATWQRFPLTTLAYRLVTLHALILILGLLHLRRGTPVQLS
jgi:putative membrane protein